MIVDPLQVAGVTLSKFEPFQTLIRGPSVPGRNEILGNIDASNFCPKMRQWHGRSAVSTAEIQGPQRRLDPKRFHQCFTGFPHEGGDRSEIALFQSALFGFINAFSLLDSCRR